MFGICNRVFTTNYSFDKHNQVSEDNVATYIARDSNTNRRRDYCSHFELVYSITTIMFNKDNVHMKIIQRRCRKETNLNNKRARKRNNPTLDPGWILNYVNFSSPVCVRCLV